MQIDKLKSERRQMVLDAVRAATGVVRLSTLRAETGIPAGTLDGLLQSLRREGLLTYDPKLGWRPKTEPEPTEGRQAAE